MSSNSNEQNVDRDWGFDINLAGLMAPTGRGSQLPEGYYKATVDDMYINPDKGDRIIIKLVMADGPFKGVIRTTGLNKPNSAEDKVRYYWRGLSESAGYTPAQLDAGEISLRPGTFLKKTVHIHFVPKDPDASDSYDTVNFLAPQEWLNQSSEFEARGGVEMAPARTVRQVTSSSSSSSNSSNGNGNGNGNGSRVIEATPVASGGTVDKESLLAKLRGTANPLN